MFTGTRKKTGNALAAGCQLFYRKIYGSFAVYAFHISGPLSPSKMKAIVSSERQFVTKRKLRADKMKTETRKMLQELYGDFNEQLARLLNDDRFKWAST